MIKGRFRMGRFVVLVCLTFLTGSISAQRFSIKTAEGYLFIQNGKELSFMLEVKGNSIEPQQVGENPSFNTDGTIVQILWIAEKTYEPSGKSVTEDLLIAHREWELDYLKDVFDRRPKPETEALKISDRSHLFWGFTRPKHADTFDRDYFITTLLGRDVIGLSSPVKAGADIKKYKDKFVEIMQSVKISKEPFDIKKLSDEIRSGTKTPS